MPGVHYRLSLAAAMASFRGILNISVPYTGNELTSENTERTTHRSRRARPRVKKGIHQLISFLTVHTRVMSYYVKDFKNYVV